MSNINKSSLATQIQTIINGLTVAVETKQRLVYLLKAAQNVGANASTISTQLQTLITTVATSESLTEVAMLINALALITTDRVLSVSSTGALPTTATPGSVYFVDGVGFPYIRRLNGDWVLIETNSQGAGATESAYAWGRNAYGALGDNTTVSKTSPVSVVGGFTNWIQVTAGYRHSVGVRADGTAWAWGRNNNGQVGDNTTVTKSSPVAVVGGFTNWVQVTAGTDHTVGVRANGTAWAWGNSYAGQVGDGTANPRSSPVSVVGGFTDWIQVSAGNNHTIGLRANGTAWGWGYNGEAGTYFGLPNGGQLGDNTRLNRSSPVSVVGGFTNWVQVSAGSNHTVAIRANGTAWAWGQNYSGRLGDNTTTVRSSPVAVAGGFSDWVQVSGGREHTVGVRANGTAWAWGRGSYGALGDGTTVTRSSPVSVVGGFTDWVQVGGGGYFCVGLRANGTAWAWGNANYGRLGDGTAVSKSSPVSVVGGFTDWVQIDAGQTISFALRS